MPLFVEDENRPTGDIFTEARRRLETPTRSSSMGTAYPRKSQQAGPTGYMSRAPGPGHLNTSTGSIYSDRTAEGRTSPNAISRATMGVSRRTGQTHRYAGTVNIGAGDSRRTLGFRTARDFERANAAIANSNRRKQAIRLDAQRRGISLKEHDMANNDGLSFGQKVIADAAGMESDQKFIGRAIGMGVGKFLRKGAQMLGKQRPKAALGRVNRFANRVENTGAMASMGRGAAAAGRGVARGAAATGSMVGRGARAVGRGAKRVGKYGLIGGGAVVGGAGAYGLSQSGKPSPYSDYAQRGYKSSFGHDVLEAGKKQGGRT